MFLTKREISMTKEKHRVRHLGSKCYISRNGPLASVRFANWLAWRVPIQIQQIRTSRNGTNPQMEHTVYDTHRNCHQVNYKALLWLLTVITMCERNIHIALAWLSTAINRNVWRKSIPSVKSITQYRITKCVMSYI